VILDARYRDGSEVSTDEIVGLLLAALFAGQHTSNITGTWMGLEILRADKNLIPRILKEQEDVLAESEGGEVRPLHCPSPSFLHFLRPFSAFPLPSYSSISLGHTGGAG
jgi:sterol 14-demethylase